MLFKTFHNLTAYKLLYSVHCQCNSSTDGPVSLLIPTQNNPWLAPSPSAYSVCSRPTAIQTLSGQQHPWRPNPHKVALYDHDDQSDVASGLPQPTRRQSCFYPYIKPAVSYTYIRFYPASTDGTMLTLQCTMVDQRIPDVLMITNIESKLEIQKVHQWIK